MPSFTVSEKSNALIKEKLQKCLFWVQKSPFTPFWTLEFSMKIKNSNCYPLMSVIKKKKKKTMKRFREKFRNVNFGCKNIPFTLFQAHRVVRTFYQKK